MRLIGLTGGIASGKSSVAKILERLGAKVVDADQLAREVVEPGEEALARIAESFGGRVLLGDGTLNRAALGEIVFADEAARRTLEAITHPAIRKRADQRLKELRETGAKVVFYMAPLIYEVGIASRFQEIWVVYLDPRQQLQRLMVRDALTREAAMARITSQMPMEQKKQLGSVVIDNNGTVEELEGEVTRAWRREILGLSEEAVTGR
ncbi:dephospho-CoA kinase [Geomonas sp. Red32]|uniref:dephospho-CoA kinase n=1 Tax=Geomonas sp. Red32 TaxID=2912856 RepID=UPI00202CAC87|nr:dephospho-CoA kinase [Geomonas sp. Red32]MCM0080073.1 dephospho-CoA kinase [Geomonas sp. Red32]